MLFKKSILLAILLSKLEDKTRSAKTSFRNHFMNGGEKILYEPDSTLGVIAYRRPEIIIIKKGQDNMEIINRSIFDMLLPVCKTRE
ncbi:hypothetical protein [uncultured Aquimarina sp.]|uniref:hypothetical protein n=1 Tax=uncultured Aquimarina sp. TaxID=575652 RepID=UPI002632F71F|nr:hypothetical protein [uncultured Aquimarina sp.]